MKTRKLWTIALAVLSLAAYISGCKDEITGTNGVCPLVIATSPTNVAAGVALDKMVTVTFNEAMNPATINADAITLLGPGGTGGRLSGPSVSSSVQITGTVTYDEASNTMSFVPGTKLKANLVYTGTVPTSVKDMKGNALQTPYVWSFSTTSIPAVATTDPANLATDVALNKAISATFTEVMDPSTITSSTFTLMNGAIPVAGKVTYSGTTALFTPTTDLALGNTYTATITTGAKNVFGTPPPSSFVWTFSTGALVLPTVTSTDPANLALNVAVNKVISATFSTAMDPSTISATTFTLKAGITAVTGTVAYAGTTATFTPTTNLSLGLTYTATITSGAKNVAGSALLIDYVWAFSTGAIVAPIVLTTDPANLATGVTSNKAISAVFSDVMNASTITATTFTLKSGATSVPGAITYAGSTATFTPTSVLLSGTTYTATITTGAKNLAGTGLVLDYVWTFTTGITPTVTSVDPLNLATAVAFNKVISANFSTAMNPSTISTSTFTLKNGATPVLGTVNYSGSTATFTPAAPLLSGVTYTATISTGAKNPGGFALASDFVWSFTAAVSPTVLSTDPVNLATAVAFNKVIGATFSTAMDPLTMIAANFTLKIGAIPVTGAVNYSGTTATFTPTINLLSGTTYTATITTGAKNLAGNPLASNFSWSFTTAVSPTVLSTDPVNLATAVALNKVIGATFSTAMDPLTMIAANFTLKIGAIPVTGTVNYSGTTATFTPTINLLSATTYTATITTGAKNLAGNPLASNFSWSFTTVAAIAPTVTSTDPADLATGVALNKVISANFSVAMDPLTITTSTFTLKLGATPVAGSVNYLGTTATFTPTVNLLSDATYTATITTGAKSALGTPIAVDYVWTFDMVPHLGPAFVDLLSVARFGIIAGVGVSNNAGFSVINDLDVGIYPGVRTGITGFGPAIIVNGASYAADDAAPVPAMLLQAKNDLVAAYNFAAAAVSPAPALAPADLGGKTLAPGIWTSGTSMLLQNGDLTLDAQGDANAVWIFQIGSTLTSIGIGPFPSSTGGNVILAGGAQAKNVFWQVGSSATIGDFTHFQGTIMAFSTITMNSGAVAEGRMLARNAAVVMTSTNIINKP